MFTFKYALKSIVRSFGRNILIAFIVIIIATAACVAMSIQQAAETAAAASRKLMDIKTQVYIDRGFIRDQAIENTGTEDMNVLMPEMNKLNKEYAITLEDFEDFSKIKKTDSDEPLVKDYYYTSSLSINGDSIKKYDLSSSTTDTTAATEAPTEAPVAPTIIDPQGNVIVQEVPTMPAPVQQEPQQPEKQGDFSMIGYSSVKAMTDFGGAESGCVMKEGEQTAIFPEDTSDYVCIIEENLSNFNDVGIGDTISFVNPNNEDETYSFKIVGIFKNSTGTMESGDDASNSILTNYDTVMDIESKSETTNKDSSSTAASNSSDTSTSDRSEETKLISQFDGTFILASVEDFDQFKEELQKKAEDEGKNGDMYFVGSSDIAAFKQGLKPLENLKAFATTFLYLTLAIGAIVLIIISVISIRDRKYEIGVLAAMGVKKLKLSMMFMLEVLIITLVSILIGVVIGSAVSVPVANGLLSDQVKQQEDKDSSQSDQPQEPASAEKPIYGEYNEDDVDYIVQVEFSVDLMVVLRMLLIGILLAVVSGFTSILFILRYDPKQILANRD